MVELITRAVQRMDPAILRKTESLGSNDKRLERCWQMELYRVILEVLPRGRVVSPDVGRVRHCFWWLTCLTSCLHACTSLWTGGVSRCWAGASLLSGG